MPALLAHHPTMTITCRECGNPIPLPCVTHAAEHETTTVVDGAALRAHLLLTHGITPDDQED